MPELLRFDTGLNDRVYLLIRWPDVLQGNRRSLVIKTQSVFFNVKTDGAGDGVGHHQRRRSQECLFGIGVNTSVEISIT